MNGSLDAALGRIETADWGGLPLHVAGHDGLFEVESRAYSPSRVGLDLFVPQLAGTAAGGVPFRWQGFTCWLLDAGAPIPPRELNLPTLTAILCSGQVAIVDRELVGASEWVLGIAPLATT